MKELSSYDLDIGYNNDGNITSKTDVGSIINYGEGNAGPHALTSIDSPVSGYEPPPQVITYTCFNKVSTIQDTIGQDSTLTLAFTYGLNNQRVKTVLSRNSTIERIKYFDGDYEEDSTSAGLKKYHYIHAPTGLVGIFVSEGTADTLYHVLSDNLGSINAVINSETNEISKYSYSAWGISRDPDDWTSELTSNLFAGRGFTAHVCEDWNWQDEVDDNSTSELIPMSAANIGKHLLEFNLINMNGRMYDPVLARFLSPDPFVQFPGMADGHNRYAYVMNNPLQFTDPSGYRSYEFINWLHNWLFTNRIVSFSGGTWRLVRARQDHETEGSDGGYGFSYSPSDPWANSNSSYTNYPGGRGPGGSMGGGSIGYKAREDLNSTSGNPNYLWPTVDGLTIEYRMLPSGKGAYLNAIYTYQTGTYYWYQTVETSHTMGGGGYGYFVDKDINSSLPWYNSDYGEVYPGYYIQLDDSPRRNSFPSGLFYWRGESSLILRKGSTYSEVITFQWGFHGRDGEMRLYDLRYDSPSRKHKELILIFGIRIDRKSTRLNSSHT